MSIRTVTLRCRCPISVEGSGDPVQSFVDLVGEVERGVDVPTEVDRKSKEYLDEEVSTIRKTRPLKTGKNNIKKVKCINVPRYRKRMK